MKVIVTSQGTDLESQVDPRFGRCANFIIVDTESLEFSAVPNAAGGAIGGAGIQAGQFIAEQGIEAVITGNVGPNASRVLSGAGIKIYVGASGTVRQAVEDFKAGKLNAASGPTVGGHWGMGGKF
ncbi:MAG: NifB/NifX family molybdenum-iron cluster-binding protein [Candidatus Tritonobacter lacicola]|nr:NifB/NifX family molybdenum-iron cluster-binding protein [Candidatus Tritonobacter lacicola]